MSARITDRQVYDAIAELIVELGHSPSLGEISERVGLFSRSTTREHLRSLRRLGLVSWKDKSPRTVRIVAPYPDSLGGAA